MSAARTVATSRLPARSPGRRPGPPPARRPRSRANIVVDDDPHTLRHVRDALTKVGYAGRVTAEPDETAGLVRAKRPQLVLLDLMLPGTPLRALPLAFGRRRYRTGVVARRSA